MLAKSLQSIINLRNAPTLRSQNLCNPSSICEMHRHCAAKICEICAICGKKNKQEKIEIC